MKSTEARPIFRVLAGILAIAGLFGTFVMIKVEMSSGSKLEVVCGMIGGLLFVTAMAVVSITGKIPLILAWILAPPPAWTDKRER
ncbi:MAG TPA: hypothetical protein PKE26_15340 [Kiritimatiellia bacterium]|nr:hypothetical protein [Kiritimatiellia bacterium]HMP00470.1 hypothetical protein [Kiritimatiellia bacterium]